LIIKINGSNGSNGSNGNNWQRQRQRQRQQQQQQQQQQQRQTQGASTRFDIKLPIISYFMATVSPGNGKSWQR